MTEIDYLGSADPKIILYLPHRPLGLEELVAAPSAAVLMAANSNHWRKIVTLLAKLASPDARDWRAYRDQSLFQESALCFTPQLAGNRCWHWIAGQDNQQRFSPRLRAELLAEMPEAPQVQMDPVQRLLLTPYPDYRQFSNRLVQQVRDMLEQQGFYEGGGQ